MSFNDIEVMAKVMRHKMLEISHTCNLSAHLGGGLSMVELMAVLYGHVLRFDKSNPRWEGRDRFILSKGHGVLGYFSALLATGFFDEATYQTFQTNGSDLIAHPVMNLDLGIESSNGSLGQGLSMGVGIALAGKYRMFGWDVREIDGHDIGQIVAAFDAPREAGKPRVLVAHTVKGKGITFMENNNEWHHNRLTKASYELALVELGLRIDEVGV